MAVRILNLPNYKVQRTETGDHDDHAHPHE
jgi:hypothetical protein